MQTQNYFSLNSEKWKQLPGGRWRVRVNNLLKYPDWLLKLRYKWFALFWKKERGWEYRKYNEIFKGRDVLEIGSGLGFDGIVYSQVANTYTYAELNTQQLDFLRRIAAFYNRTNILFEHFSEPLTHVFPRKYSAFLAHGVLHHIPFELAQQEFRNIDKYLETGAYCVFLMYPKERWEMCGKPDFTQFGKYTDGGCPWTEYYDLDKMQRLVGKKYRLTDVSKWGGNAIEFVNFEFIKEAESE